MGDSTEYIFNRDFKSSNRLNFNHWLMKEISGYLIHPAIGRIPDDGRVADIGAGTGIWLMEAATTLPETVKCDGFDISTAQYPPKPWWPKNVSLHSHDAFQPFPEHLRGKYDLVHARFFLCLVNDHNAEQLLRNMVSLLKPGGHLQWFEVDANNASAISFNDQATTESVDKLAASFRKPSANSSYNWLNDMPQLYAKLGLSMVRSEKHPVKDHLRLPWAQSNLAGCEDLISGREVVVGGQVESMARLIDGSNKEFKNGVSLDTPFVCFVGRKI